MPQNDFLLWATGVNANVLSQAAFAGLGNLHSGVVAGTASGQLYNKTTRQASIISSMIAQFIIDRLNVDVIDDGTIANIETNFIRAIASVFTIPNTGVVPGTYGPTMTIAVQADGRVTSISNAALPPTVGPAAGTYPGATVTVTSTGLIAQISSVAYGQIGGNNEWQQQNTFDKGVDVVGVDANGFQFRAANSLTTGFGAGLRNDGTYAYLLSTAANTPLGAANAFRPFYWNLTTGAVVIDGTGVGVTIGGNTTIQKALSVTGASGTISASQNIYTSQNFVLTNAHYLYGADTGNNVRALIGFNGSNYCDIYAGTSGILRGLRYDGGLQLFATDAAGNFNVTADSNANGHHRAAQGVLAAGNLGNNSSICPVLADFPWTGANWTQLPNGMIMQWGSFGAVAQAGNVAFSMNRTWPQGVPLMIVASYECHNNPSSGSIGVDFSGAPNGQFIYQNTAPAGTHGCYYWAVGF